MIELWGNDTYQEHKKNFSSEKLNKKYSYDLEYKKKSTDERQARSKASKIARAKRLAAMSSKDRKIFLDKEAVEAAARTRESRGQTIKFNRNARNHKSMLWHSLVSRTYDNPKSPFTLSEESLKLIGSKTELTRLDMEKIVLMDKKGNSFKWDTLESYVKKHVPYSWEEVTKSYKIKEFVNTEGLTQKINKALIPDYDPKKHVKQSGWNVAHDKSFNLDPWKTHIAPYKANIQEGRARKKFDTLWEGSDKEYKEGKITKAKRFELRKQAVSTYYTTMEPITDIRYSLGKKLKGSETAISELFERAGISLTATQTKALDLSTPEGRLLNRQQGTVKILNKILENNKIYEFSELAKEDPAGFLKAVKEHELASKILNKPGLVKGALRALSGWIKKESGPMGWIGSIATIDAAFGVYELGQGATPLQALDTTFWFLPKWVFKADERTFKAVYQRAGFTDEDFGEFQKWMKLEDLDQQYFMSERKLKFMQDQVLGKQSDADIAYEKEVDALGAYKDMGWNRPLGTITSEERETGKHPFYGFAVDEHNRIITESQDVFKSLTDEKKSRKDLEYSRKFAAMERTNRKKQMHLATLEGQLGYGESMEEILDRAGKLDLLYPEYVHPIEGPGVSQKQMLATGLYPHASGGRTGYTNGGLTRTVAPDSEGIMSLKKK